MAHEIDLKKYQIRTDIIVETYDKNNKNKGIDHKEKQFGDVLLEETTITKEGENICNKKCGLYKTITFDDITDKDNFKNVEKVLIETLKNFLKEKEISETSTCLIIGLGNEKSTPDALGPEVINKILVTKYLFNIGEVQKGYRNVASFKPSVTGVTGIETKELVKGVVDVVKPDFLIVIDALAASSISRVNKTIQITDTGISPGSGIGNNREEISISSLGIPVIAIGVPTVVDAATIVTDTFKYMLKQFSFKIKNQDNKKLKFVPESHQNYLEHEGKLTSEEKEKVLGMIGTLTETEFKSLINEVLNPINYNLMVTVKEVDFIIEKLALLLSNGINKSLHEAYNTTNI